MLNEKIKKAIHEKQSSHHSLSVDAVSSELPPGVDVKLFLKHGFYQHKNKLYFKTVKTELSASDPPAEAYQ